MKALLVAAREKIVKGNGTKALLERSGVRAFLGTLLSVAVLAWAKDEAVVQAMKDNVETLLPLLLLALGLATGTSKK